MGKNCDERSYQPRGHQGIHRLDNSAFRATLFAFFVLVCLVVERAEARSAGGRHCESGTIGLTAFNGIFLTQNPVFFLVDYRGSDKTDKYWILSPLLSELKSKLPSVFLVRVEPLYPPSYGAVRYNNPEPLELVRDENIVRGRLWWFKPFHPLTNDALYELFYDGKNLGIFVILKQSTVREKPIWLAPPRFIEPTSDSQYCPGERYVEFLTDTDAEYVFVELGGCLSHKGVYRNQPFQDNFSEKHHKIRIYGDENGCRFTWQPGTYCHAIFTAVDAEGNTTPAPNQSLQFTVPRRFDSYGVKCH